MTLLETANVLPIAMLGGTSPIQNLSSEELDRVAGGTITYHCDNIGTDQQKCEAADCD